MAVFLYSCQKSSDNNTDTELLNLQQWSLQNLEQLKSLWIGNRKPEHAHKTKISGQVAAIKLGEMIFSDQRFSANGKISCASCHQADKYFTDGIALAQGIRTTTRNTPTIAGASFNQWLFLDGRADSLWAQALGPLENLNEHATNRSQVAHIVYSDHELRRLYESLFGLMPDLTDNTLFPENAGPFANSSVKKAWQTMSLTNQHTINQIFVNIGKSLAAYEESIQPQSSRFDHYVEALIQQKPDINSVTLTKSELSGMKIFMTKGTCILCHSGPYFTDNSFHNIATVTTESAINDWGRYHGARQVLSSEFNCRGIYSETEQGKCTELEYIVLEKDHTMAAFKTPGLRNVSKTAPYMHDGQYSSLEQVIDHYVTQKKNILGHSELILSISLTESEKSDLLNFLRSLDNH